MFSDLGKVASFPPYSCTYRLLPATLSDMLRVVLCFSGTGSVASCITGCMIHEVLHLFCARSVNGAQKRTDCVCCACVKGWDEFLFGGWCICIASHMSTGYLQIEVLLGWKILLQTKAESFNWIWLIFIDLVVNPSNTQKQVMSLSQTDLKNGMQVTYTRPHKILIISETLQY